MPAGARPWPPLKMTSSVFLARSALALLAQHPAHSVGDVRLAAPVRSDDPGDPGSNAKTVRLRKLLKPWISRRVKRGARKGSRRRSSRRSPWERHGCWHWMCLSGTDRMVPSPAGTGQRAGRPGGGLRVTDTRTATRGGRRGSLRVLQPPRLRLGLSTGALYPMPTEDVPGRGRPRRTVRSGDHAPDTGRVRHRLYRELSTRCRNAGSRVHAVHLWQQLHPLLSPYARRAREGRTLFARAIEGAVELGAKVIVWHGPSGPR